MPKKERSWMAYLQRLDCLKPSRKVFDFEEVDFYEGLGIWDAPALAPTDKRRIKYCWLVLHDGRVLDRDIAREIYKIIMAKWPGVYKFFEKTCYEYDADFQVSDTHLPARDGALPPAYEDEDQRRGRMILDLKAFLNNDKDRNNASSYEDCAENYSEFIDYLENGSVKLSCPKSRKGNGDVDKDSRNQPTQCCVRHTEIQSWSHVQDRNNNLFGKKDDEKEEDYAWLGGGGGVQTGAVMPSGKGKKSTRAALTYFHVLFMRHLVKLIKVLDRLVKKIDSNETILEMSFQLKTFHEHFIGIGKAHFRCMFQSVDAALAIIMDPKIYRKRIRESFIIFLELIYYSVTFQMDSHVTVKSLAEDDDKKFSANVKMSTN